MPATLYPRINIPGPLFDPRDGEARTPLRISPFVGPLDGDVFIPRSDADLAAAGVVTVSPGAAVPDAPGQRLLPFRLETNGVVHLRIALLGDPVVGAPPPSLVNIKIALVPNIEIPAAGLSIDDSPVSLASDWLPVGNTLAIKTVAGGYAQLQGSALMGASGNIMPLTLTVSEAAPTAAINATWFLAIKSDVPVWATFAVSEANGDTASVVALPWIHIPSVSASIALTGPFTPGTTTSPAGLISGVRNFGPGDLTISPSGTTEGDGTDSVSVIGTSIGASASGAITLGYTANDGLSGLPIDIASNDPTSAAELVGDFHNARISVSAETVGIADTVLVLDASGSMLLRPDGIGFGSESAADPAARRRWDNLVTAVDHLAFGYVNFLIDEVSGGGTSLPSRLGVAVFPDVLGKGTPGWQTRAATLMPSATVSLTLPTTLHSSLLAAGAAVEGSGLTPMGDGIGVAMGTDTVSSGMFETQTDAHRRWMVLMTDGAHNAGTLHPTQFYLPDAVGDFLAKQVRLYAIGYSTAAGGTAVDLLQNLAAHAIHPVDGVGLEESRYTQAAVTAGFEKSLTDTFLDALAVSIGLTPTYDPVGVLSAASPIAIHEFEVSPFDTGIGIFLDWHSHDAKIIHLALISPHCERFDQEQLEQREDFQFRALPGYSHAYISRAALAGGESGPRYGTWKLELRLGAQIKGGETYKFSIFNRSGLRLLASTTRARWSTGQAIELVAHLQAYGAPVGGARVVATIDTPNSDYGSLLAGAVVKPGLLEETKKASPADLGQWEVKARALAIERPPLAVSRAQRELVLHEVAPGQYRGTLPPAPCGGVYTMHLVASGHAEGVAYRREQVVTTNVEVLPDRARTLITYTLAADDRVIVSVRPRDANGNPVIFDSITSPRLGINVRDAKPVTGVINSLDGTYTRTFSLPGTGHPELVVSYDGRVVGRPSPLPDPKTWHWMERVVAYEPGDSKHCEPHDDPKQALGPVCGPDDPYVQICGCGSLTLAAGRLGFVATHIAVFTHAESMQPYRVYAGVKLGRRWVEIGVGHGPTQVFEVPTRWGPIHGVIVRHARGKGDPVLVQGVGYTRHRKPLFPRIPH